MANARIRENTVLEFKIYYLCVFNEFLKEEKKSSLGTSDIEYENRRIAKHVSSPVLSVGSHTSALNMYL